MMTPPLAAPAWRHDPGISSDGAPRQRSSRGRKMLADIAFADAAQDRVGEGVQAGIGVGMAFQRMVVRHLHAAQPDMIAVARNGARHSPCAVRIIAERQQALRPRRNPPSVVTLIFFSSPSTISTFRSRQLRQRHVVGHLLAGMGAVRRQDLGKAKALRRLGAIKIVARHQGPAPFAIAPPQGVGDRHHRHGAVARRFPAPRSHRAITWGETSGRAASWISTKSGASLPALPAPAAPIPAASRRRSPAAGRARPASAARRQTLPVRRRSPPARGSRETPRPSGAASACRPGVHIVSAGSVPARSPFPAATIKTAMRGIPVPRQSGGLPNI